jgi:hypothetical protein
MNELDDLLPPYREGENPKQTYRKFQTALPTDIYVQLELDAAKRGLTFYKLVQSLLTLYANGRLQVKPNTIPAQGHGQASTGEPAHVQN